MKCILFIFETRKNVLIENLVIILNKNKDLHLTEGSSDGNTAIKSYTSNSFYCSSSSKSGNQIQSTVPRPVYGKYMRQHWNKKSASKVGIIQGYYQTHYLQ